MEAMGMFSLATTPASQDAPSLPGATMRLSLLWTVPSARTTPQARPFSIRRFSTKVPIMMSHFGFSASYMLLRTSREASVPI